MKTPAAMPQAFSVARICFFGKTVAGTIFASLLREPWCDTKKVCGITAGVFCCTYLPFLVKWWQNPATFSDFLRLIGQRDVPQGASVLKEEV
ncbi:MAG: hypothetical protein IJN76_02725 [Clostridia bacterium]|nr:hypothetical protein [Clostridia bacterium]